MAADARETVNNACGTAAITRSRTYRFLSVAFRYPNVDITGELRERRDLLEEVKELYPILPTLTGTIDSLRRTIESIEDVIEAQLEYTRLFIGPFHVPAPPYESVYRAESRGKMMGDAALRVRQSYLDEGLSFSESVRDLPDHLIAELEFMSYLTEEEASLWQKEAGVQVTYPCLKKQETFLGEHLTKWIPQFAAAVSRESREELYCLLAKVLEAVVLLDYDYVKALMYSPELQEQ